MDYAVGFGGFHCVECGDRIAPDASDRGRCPDCGGPLAPDADLDAVATGAVGDGSSPASMWDVESLLPFEAETAVSMGEGATPLVSCPALAEELGVARVLYKDEGQNPTGTTADRQLSVAVTAARARGSRDVALPSTGADGVAAAAYATRAGLDAHVFVPTRSSHGAKATINVHDADMTVVEGRYPDAVDAYEDAMADADWTPLAPDRSPLRVAGAGTVLLEIVAGLDWTAPDAVVYPAGHGIELAGAHAVLGQLDALDRLDSRPRLCATQATGCAPIASAVGEGSVSVQAWDCPDTIVGALEVPDPVYGDAALEAVEASGGDAVAVADDAILESACTIAAHEGLEASVAGGAGAAGAWELTRDGAFDADDTIVLVDPMAGSLDADVLRSHLMGAGI